ncbi:PAQR family membrane homeostasis protein TrhA [Cyclobacterium qasimii]|uniref:Hemolysin III family protein n=2 Tax=Cyclobacterium qasimii TaxID=1350429 RepID=A0A512CF94_9BACT|nr:hemolysin III family protein [Cyclobacterium qasimii]EPR66858.1 putative membrane protein hemolysin III-like protein [Cyclobacterium qasimii M12-11B]GEO22904.1 hemolysin III family protein [Cyclobacterium qasimii]
MAGQVERKQTIQEEFANTVTHLIGILFSIVAISLLVVFSVLNGTALHVVSCCIFGATMLLLYTSSTLYHAIQSNELKPLLRSIDHISIYFLISGTYTPFLLIGLGGTLGWVYFGIVWTITLLGLVFKIFFIGRFEKLSLILYLGMGWMALLLIKPLVANLSTEIIYLIAAGGLAYTIGTVFYANKKMLYAHAIWHVFVLAGTVLHFIAILFMIT